MSKRRGLGKGLGALIPVAGEDRTEYIEGQENYREINIDEIRPAPGQARHLFDEEKLAELAASIKEHGVIQPVIVRPLTEGGYQLIAGERRWRACCNLKYHTIPAIIKNYQDLEASAVSLIENVQRENLNPLEEAMAYQQLIKEYGLTQEEVSGRVGKSRPFVANMVRLLELTEEVKDMLAGGRISAGHARALLSVKDPKKQVSLAVKTANQQLNVRQIEKITADMISKEKEKDKVRQKANIKKQYLQEIETVLIDFLGGAQVKLMETNGGGGKMEIRYNDITELKKILEAMLGKENVSRETFS